MFLRRCVAMLFVAGLAGLAFPVAGKDLAGSLRGKWLMDKAAALEASAPPFYKLATPEKKKEIRDDMLKTMPDMVFEFTATTITMKAGDKSHAATYKVTKSEKNTLWFDTVSTENGGKPLVDKMAGEFLDADTLKLTKEGDPAPFILKRVK